MTRRSGATLVEVLVTIFVMALGLIALLTLFPIGAKRMSEAIKDSRTALAAANADSIAAARTLRQDTLVSNRLPRANPAGGPASPPAPQDGPSYPVYMDPIGWRSYSGTGDYGTWMAGVKRIPGWPNNDIGIPRVSASFVESGGVPARIRAALTGFSLLDDLTFGQDGVPVDPNGKKSTDSGFTNIQREGRYSWGLLFKRPKTATQSVVDLTVVVYSGRPLQLSSGIGQPPGEAEYSAEAGDLDGKIVVIVPKVAGQEPPRIRKGGWILDSTAERPYDPAANPPDLNKPVLRYGPVHGHFYRVESITEEPGGKLRLQLATPLKAPINNADGRTPKVIIMDNVVEVFEKGPGRLP